MICDVLFVPFCNRKVSRFPHSILNIKYSIIIPSYNQENYIEATLQNVIDLKQNAALNSILIDER